MKSQHKPLPPSQRKADYASTLPTYLPAPSFRERDRMYYWAESVHWAQQGRKCFCLALPAVLYSGVGKQKQGPIPVLITEHSEKPEPKCPELERGMNLVLHCTNSPHPTLSLLVEKGTGHNPPHHTLFPRQKARSRINMNKLLYSTHLGEGTKNA